jgi:hypothetical protein
VGEGVGRPNVYVLWRGTSLKLFIHSFEHLSL